MSIIEFANNIRDILVRSPVSSGRPLRWIIIANPKAGGFTIKRRWEKHRQVLSEVASGIRAHSENPAGALPAACALQLDAGDGSLAALGLVPTLRPEHANEIARRFLDEAADNLRAAKEAGTEPPLHLIITAGGDGTSLETLNALFSADTATRAQCAILRLPMGTGNDGADARELEQALRLLTEPTRIEYACAVRLKTATPGKGPWLAFNILSLGLDAFVTHMTNKMKGNLPGDSYKIWVDIAALLYDRVYRINTMKVSARDAKGRPVSSFSDRLLLIAMGASGNRTYGSNKKILPDQRNVCAVSQMPLLRKLALKGQFLTGEHATSSEARLFTAARLQIEYDTRILAQMDGEAVKLEKADFPVTLELTEPVIPILKKKA